MVAIYCNWETQVWEGRQGELGVLFWIAKCQKPIGHLNGDAGEATGLYKSGV